jgi:ATP-dependent HslUV protease ATP-binding subunit HslU
MLVEQELTPREIVAELDRYVVGQHEAKRAVAIALRNRYRRRQLPPDLRDEVAPKNILMIGPTGVGKTEIARRLSRLAHAPFIKVEATKFTEVGYVGRDVESIIRDLVETSLRMVKLERIETVRDRAEQLAEERLLEGLLPSGHAQTYNPFSTLLSIGPGRSDVGSTPDEQAGDEQRTHNYQQTREKLREKLRRGELEDQLIEVELEDGVPPVFEAFNASGMEEMGINLQDLFGHILPSKKRKRKLTVAQARRQLIQEESQKLIDHEDAVTEAIYLAEQSGIVFIDEIDKIAAKGHGSGPDVSREGVQRDILPIVEGSTVTTKYGPVRTDHILFIAAGAFHIMRPSDLIPELQGRFPIRVELESLTQDDFYRILLEPHNALVKQYTALLATEGITLRFTDDAIRAIAEMAEQVNTHAENIGARRLHTIMEKLLEELSFNAPEATEREVTVTEAYVHEKLRSLVQDQDLSRYIL